MTQKYSDAMTPLVTSIAEIQVSFVANYCRPLLQIKSSHCPLKMNGYSMAMKSRTSFVLKVQVLIVQKKVSAHPATFENGTL